MVYNQVLHYNQVNQVLYYNQVNQVLHYNQVNQVLRYNQVNQVLYYNHGVYRYLPICQGRADLSPILYDLQGTALSQNIRTFCIRYEYANVPYIRAFPDKLVGLGFL